MGEGEDSLNLGVKVWVKNTLGGRGLIHLVFESEFAAGMNRCDNAQ